MAVQLTCNHLMAVRICQEAPLKNPLRPKDEQIRPSQVFLLGKN